MPRTKALWISAIFTIAVVLVVGAALMRPTLSHPEANAAPAATLVGSDSLQPAAAILPTVQTSSSDHGDDHDSHHKDKSSKLHKNHEEHHDDD